MPGLLKSPASACRHGRICPAEALGAFESPRAPGRAGQPLPGSAANEGFSGKRQVYSCLKHGRVGGLYPPIACRSGEATQSDALRRAWSAG